MPPRRSSRSARASVEPTHSESTNTSKRKRPHVPEDKAPTEEKENVEKPSSARRSSSRASLGLATKARVSARARGSLTEVAETDEDQEDDDNQLPPIKKPRPSLPDELDDEEQSEEEEDVRPRRRKGSAAPRSKVPRSRGKKQTNAIDYEEGDGHVVADISTRSREVQPPRRRGRLTSSKPSRKAKPTIQTSDDEDSETDMNDEAENSIASTSTKPSSKRPTKASHRTPKLRTAEQAEYSDGSELEPPPPAPVKQPTQADMDSDEEAAMIANAVARANEEEDKSTRGTDEEETSLLDPPTISKPLGPRPSFIVAEESHGLKSRLVIHKMALVNFKSYAGRQEIGPFHKSFSAIVGPNGSGKSNTIDALLFVFGYRASKMRQAKLSELIHTSARHPNLDECSVEVHFREIIDLPGPDAFKVVPNSQLVVARQAFKNNSSKYTINSIASNFTEVQTLLKGRGIDLDHKRFLILQGEVESIAQMKPKAPSEHEEGLLEYLEDIIGTSKYKESIEEALEQMDHFAEERGEKLNRLRHVEKEKNALEDKKREAEDYLRMQNEHVMALSRLWQWYLWKCLMNEEELEKTIAQTEKELAEETERNKDDIEHLKMLEQHFEERGKAYEEVKAASVEAVKDLGVHEKQEIGLQEKRKHASGKLKKLKKSLDDDQHNKAAALRAIEDNAETIEREKAKVDKHEANLDKEEKVLEGIRDSLKDKTQVFHDQIEVKQKELQPWTTKINTKEAEINVATSERDALAKKAEDNKQASRAAQDELEKLRVDQVDKLQRLENLKTSKANLQSDRKRGEQDLEDAKARVRECRGNASSSRQKADEAKASQHEYRSQGKVLDHLIRLRNNGHLRGFHGRLGSLGTIPDKYDVAITTACPSLNHLVVDTVEQGQMCIEHLRSQNVGRASFLVLEKLNHNRDMDKIQTPENVPRLFDLIKPKEPRFAPAFFKAVHNTLVADNLDQANRIAYGQRRWRVVTLAGQLIDSSGTMSGGGTTVARGGMSSKLTTDAVRPEDLRQLEKESEDAARELEAALNELHRLEVEVEELARAGPQIDIDFQKMTLEIQNGKNRTADAEKRLRELKSQTKPDAGDIARIARLEQEIATSTEELEGLQEKSGKIQSAIKDLEKKILDIGGARLLAQKSKVDGIRLHINIANDEITKAEVGKAKAEKDCAKFDTSIKTSNLAIQEVDAEVEDLSEQLNQLSQYVNDLRAKVEAAQTAAENSREDLQNLKEELDMKTEEIQGFRQKEMELQQTLDEARKEYNENAVVLDHWRTEHDKLTLEEIDSDDDEEDDDEHQRDAAGSAPAEGGVAVKSENGEGPEPKAKGKARQKTPSNELHMYSVEELAKFKKREMIADTELLDEKLKRAKPNFGALEEYRKREQEFLKRAKDLEYITNQRDAQKQKYESLRKQRLDEFMAGFSLISLKLKEMYQMITLGGNAELELVDSMDPFSEGIIFSVMPPKKSWKNISNLSGGEKTLSSLALVFALHVFKPTPLYFMDEIDAALDFRNVSIVANYIKDRTKNAQFIIISLRNDMFELSHRLIGIYKTSNATQSISIDNHPLPVPAANAFNSN